MSSQTQASLLERLRDAADPMAWDEFFGRYWRLIHRFARLRGCSEHTAEEIVQEAMVAVFRQRDVFRYDPQRGRFRDWLLTIVRNLIAKHRRQPAARLHTLANDAPALADLEAGEAEPDAAWEAAFEETLLATLLDTVRREVAPETYQAFELLVLYERSGREVARVTGLSRNAAYLARKRVLARLRELGADYRDHGRLDERLRQAMNTMPAWFAERSVSERVERRLTSLKEPSR
ncbi:MAG: sigma-70 family RNA polymerase sigma factor [Pirellulaceae bacterium]|nr:sigma-70 family RNA polymerase sigma factor [Pirellulaceae bacterium]